MTPIYKKKGETKVPQNHLPVFMLPCTRKVIEIALVERITQSTEIFGRHFGFQRGLSQTMKLIDVNAVVSSRRELREKFEEAGRDKHAIHKHERIKSQETSGNAYYEPVG